MRFAGKLLLTGAAVVVLWKVMAALFVGILGMALKVGLVLLAVYVLLQILEGRNKREE
jgi:membrane protein implicated in regulation of membrane protease activity